MAYRQIEDDKELIWTNKWRCSKVPILALIGGSAGLFLTIVIIGVICVIVAINLRDLREWKRYLAEKEENERRFGNITNPLYVGNSTGFANPTNRRSFFGR